MDLREILVVEVIIAYVVTALVTVFYGVIAPWYKQAAGRYIFYLLLSLALLLTNSVIRFLFPNFVDGGRIIGIFLFGFYIVSIVLIGNGIYKAQITHWNKRRFISKEKERHRQL